MLLHPEITQEGRKVDTPVDTKGLEIKFAAERRGISDPARQVAIELEHITTVLLEVLKELRLKR